MAKIIIAEDEQIVAKDIKMQLQKLGYEVLATLTSGEEVLKQATETSPDLILMDVKLDGEMDGVETAQRLRQDYNIHVIYLTAYADSSTMARIRNTEPYGYILKPYSLKDLKSNIEAALKKIAQKNKRVKNGS